MPSLQQSDGLFLTNLAVGISTLRLRMEFIFAHNVAICLHSCGLACAVISLGGDAIALSRIFINPRVLKPLARVGVIRRDKMKALRVCE